MAPTIGYESIGRQMTRSGGAMTERTVHASWQPGPLRCDVVVDGFELRVDEPPSAGGTGTGPQPTDLFLSSVASCFALALAYANDKLSLSATAIEVEVTGTYDGPRFSAIEIRPKVTGVSGQPLERLISSARRVCYVTNTLTTPPVITVSAVEPAGT